MALIKLLQLNEKQVVAPGIDCYLEPYLKAVMDKYKDPIPALTFLYYMTHPLSPYNNLSDEEKEKSILEIYKGEYKRSDKEIKTALKELDKRYESIQKRMLQSTKKAINGIIDFNNTIDMSNITMGKDGNYSEIINSQLKTPQLMEAYTKIEKAYEESIMTKYRGDLEAAYDEHYDD
jgi:DNA-binding ferritin-like protein (Dps family)